VVPTAGGDGAFGGQRTVGTGFVGGAYVVFLLRGLSAAVEGLEVVLGGFVLLGEALLVTLVETVGIRGFHSVDDGFGRLRSEGVC
jgi:hypothetical protein